MSIVRFQPSPAAFRSLFSDEFFRAGESLGTRGDARNFVPRVNVKETDSAFHLEFAAPGRKREDLKVSVENDTLTVSYQPEKSSQEQTSEKVRRTEFVRSSFSRSFTLPEHVSGEAVEATYQDGILTVSLPKREVPATPAARVIEIK